MRAVSDEMCGVRREKRERRGTGEVTLKIGAAGSFGARKPSSAGRDQQGNATNWLVCSLMYSTVHSRVGGC